MEDENKFKVGDVVTLKSGGPCMTVVEASDESPYVMTVRYEAGSCGYETHQFQRAALERGYPDNASIASVARELHERLSHGIEVKVTGG